MFTHKTTGIGAIVLALGFNVPFAILGATFDYPDILRQPASMVLDRFANGGPGLVLTWLAFMACALAMLPVSIALSKVLPGNDASVRRSIALAAGSAAALAQAIGLSRWVFAVPHLARIHADPASDATTRQISEQLFSVLNDWGGVAIGENLGQTLSAMFLLSLASMQFQAAGRVRQIIGGVGLVAAVLMIIGLGEGISIALGRNNDSFALATIIGYLGLSLWLLATGIQLLAGKSEPRDSAISARLPDTTDPR